MPYYRFELTTILPSADVMDLVRSMTRKEPDAWQEMKERFSLDPGDPQRPFLGEVGETTFRLRRDGGRLSRTTQIRGRVDAAAAGSTLQVLVRLHPLVGLIPLVMAGGFVRGGIELLSRSGTGYLFYFGAALGVIAISLAGFALEAIAARRLFEDALRIAGAGPLAREKARLAKIAAERRR